MLTLAAVQAGCGGKTTAEEEVRAVVAEAERAAEARNAPALSGLVADDYQDGRGNDAREIRRYLHGYLIAHQSVHLLVRIESVELKAKDLAQLRATVGMLGQEAAGASAWDLAADVYEFDVVLARESGDWKVIRADWRPALAH